MPSALIPAGHSYRAMLLAEQLAHQRSVHPGPLVLGAAPVKPPPPATDRDRTVSRRSKPSSRTALMGDRKSTRLNSSHTVISYAVFCLKKKNTRITHRCTPLR